jgi:hypothetical protein
MILCSIELDEKGEEVAIGSRDVVLLESWL